MSFNDNVSFKEIFDTINDVRHNVSEQYVEGVSDSEQIFMQRAVDVVERAFVKIVKDRCKRTST